MTTKGIHFFDINPEAYEILGAKLMNLCNEQYGSGVSVKIITLFSDQDHGRGNAILWLTKHFGVFPVEIGTPFGGLEIHELAELVATSSLTLIIQSVPLFETLKESNSKTISPVNNNDKITQIDGPRPHLPTIKGVAGTQIKASVNMLNNQIGILNKYLASSRHETTGPICYLGGFSLEEGSTRGKALPSSKLIPWYLSLGREGHIGRIFRQPELNTFLLKLPTNNPNMINIESAISDMEIGIDYDGE